MPNNLTGEQIDVLKRAGYIGERGSYYRKTDEGIVALREAD